MAKRSIFDDSFACYTPQGKGQGLYSLDQCGITKELPSTKHVR